MSSFRESHSYFIYICNFMGLYFKSVEKLTDNKWLIWSFKTWSTLGVILLFLYSALLLPYLFRADISTFKKLGLFRTNTINFFFLIKIIFFYLNAKKLEKLIDAWDSSFEKPLHPIIRQVNNTIDTVKYDDDDDDNNSNYFHCRKK